MRLIVFGANGALGRRLLMECLERGLEVTGVVRDASRFEGASREITILTADATDPSAIASVASGHDIALSAVTQHSHPEVLPQVAASLLVGLSRAGVRRLVVAGGAGNLEIDDIGTLLMDTPDFRDEWKPEAQAQVDAFDVFRDAETDVEWTYVSPGAVLEPGERTGEYRTDSDRLLTDADGRSQISMEDFAIAMVDEALEPKHARERFTAAY
jgi:putative NADH-flavin reductase